MTAPPDTAKDFEGTKSGRVTELFPYEMPFRASSAIGALVIAIFAAVVFAAVVVEVPETVRCSFVLATQGGSDALRSPHAGTLDAVHAAEGRQVGAGDVLFVIRSKEFHAWRTELGTIEKDLDSIGERRALALKTYENNLDTAQTTVAQREQEAAYQQEYLTGYRDIVSRVEKLAEEGLSSPVEMLEHRLGLAGAERDAALAAHKVEIAQMELKKLDNELERQVAEIELERKKLEVRAGALRDSLADSEGDLAAVRAPFSGVVLSVALPESGGVVAVGQELCQIAREGATLHARLEVGEQGVPRLARDQSVRLFFDAFPYQRYGTLGGTLDWVSPAAVQSGGQDAFVARAALAEDAFDYKGERRALRVGMGGQARIQVARRTLIEYALEPIRQLRENMQADE